MRASETIKIFALALAAIVGGALIWLVGVNIVANIRLQRKLAALHADGQPLALAQLERAPIPPQDNAATYLNQAQSDLEAIQKAVTAVAESQAVADLKAAGMSGDDVDRSEPMLEAYRQALAAHPDVWPLLKQAAACPDYDPLLDFSTGGSNFFDNMEPATGLPRSAARALRYRALSQLADGHREDAFETCLTALRLARHFDSNPTLVGTLVAMAVRSQAIDTTNLVLRSGPLPAQAYAALEQELAGVDSKQNLQHAFRTERALGLQMWDELPFAMVVGRLTLTSTQSDKLCYLEYLDAAIDRAGSSYSDPRAKHQMDQVLSNAGTLTNLFAPAANAAATAAADAEAKCRALRVLAAILARQQAGAVGEPQLTDLGLPAEVTTDPFNDQPLVLKRTPDGWLIYSVGRDLHDDGGWLNAHGTDVGVWPVSTPATAAQPAP